MSFARAGFKAVLAIAVVTATAVAPGCRSSGRPPAFEGRHFSGRGDVEYLKLLEFSRRLFAPDPEFQNLAMLYQPDWNGLVEGPTWDAWWIQNSYGTAYSAMPFLEEPFLTFLQNAQALWFDQMGDGRRRGRPNNEVAPDGSLCDCAGPGWAIYKQGDGRTKIHDWGYEFAAAGIVMQAELLLETRDAAAAARYLPMLERTAAFIDSRRDPANNLFLVGAAANLLAPSYAGRLKPDGTYDKAYLAGLSITTIAALDRLVELEKLAGREAKAEELTRRRELVRSGLPLLQAPGGYFVKSLDPDGTKHGVFGAARYGYFEASPNHDAIAFRVVPDEQARKIYSMINAIPQLRPFDLVLPNYPGLDDMYEKPEGLWKFGHWVNGGHWSTCEARMILAYCRLGMYDDARRSVLRMMDFARHFRMDNPLTNFGSEVYQPKESVNITIDAFGPMAALIRGLFEYIYSAGSLTLYPHIPPAVTELHQKDPIRFGTRKLYLSTFGAGPVSTVRVNGRNWAFHDTGSITLPYDGLPEAAAVEIYLGGAKPGRASASAPCEAAPDITPKTPKYPQPETLSQTPILDSTHPIPSLYREGQRAASQERSEGDPPKAGEPTALVPGGRGAKGDTGAKPNRDDYAEVAGTPGLGPVLTDEIVSSVAKWRRFLKDMTAAGLGETYEAAHARLVLEAVGACRERRSLLAAGAIPALPEKSERAADQAYVDTAVRLDRGLDAVLKSYRDSPDARKASIYAIYIRVGEGADGN